MKLRQLLSVIDNKSLAEYPVLLFSGTTHQPLFSALLLEKIKQHSSCVTLDLAAQELSYYMPQLQTSFLGQSMIYWLKNGQELDDKHKTQLLAFLKEYSGPHTICLFLPEVTSFHAVAPSALISLDAPIDKELLVTIASWLGVTLSKKHDQLTSMLFSKSVRLSLDLVCQICRYLLTAATVDQALLQWIENSIQPEQSLFVLSQHFFAKNAVAFFNEWQRVALEYPDVFWITFWSEQLWRASQVIVFHQQQQPAQAKSIGFRLPFSFLQSDWKKYSYQELQSAHDYIYGMDHQIKNGGELFCFDLFYSSFFNDAFKSMSH